MKLTADTTHVAAYQSLVDKLYDRIKSKYPDLPLEKSEIDTLQLLTILPGTPAKITIKYDPLSTHPFTKHTGIITINTAVGGSINHLDPREEQSEKIIDKFVDKANQYTTLQHRVSQYDNRLLLYPHYYTDQFFIEWRAPTDPTHDPKVGHLPWESSFDKTWFAASTNPRSADYIGRLLK
jgi:hypothetical protein